MGIPALAGHELSHSSGDRFPDRTPNPDSERSPVPSSGQNAVQLGSGGDAELGEDLA